MHNPRQAPGLTNIYMELGSTFGQLVTTHSTVCAHLLGQVIGAFGADHVLWGTDSIWYGTPQWQIDAFRRFTIPEALAEKHGYAPLTRAVKEQIFGLNAARLFGVDVHATRNAIPQTISAASRWRILTKGLPQAIAGMAGSHADRWRRCRPVHRFQKRERADAACTRYDCDRQS